MHVNSQSRENSRVRSLCRIVFQKLFCVRNISIESQCFNAKSRLGITECTCLPVRRAKIFVADENFYVVYLLSIASAEGTRLSC